MCISKYIYRRRAKVHIHKRACQLKIFSTGIPMMVAARSFYKSGYLHCLIRVLVQLYDVYKGTHGPGHTLL